MKLGRIAIAAATAAVVLAPLAAQADPRCRTQSLRGEWMLSFAVPGGTNATCEIAFVNRQGSYTGHCQFVHHDPHQTEWLWDVQQHYVTGDFHVSRYCALTGTFDLQSDGGVFSIPINGQVWSGNSPWLTAGTAHLAATEEGYQMHAPVFMNRIAWSDPAFPAVPPVPVTDE